MAISIPFLMLLPLFSVRKAENSPPLYLDAAAPVELRVKDLMQRMTLSEKIAQMAQYVGPEHMKKAEKNMTVEEMRKSDAQGFYPGLFSEDVARMVKEGKIGSFLHVLTVEEANYLQGLALESRLKIPLLIGIDAIHGNGLYRGATIYPSPISMAATWEDGLAYAIGRQTALEMRATGTHWAFTPNLDVLRDPRWGRCGETFGEDPFLVGNMGVQQILGLQTTDFSGTDKVIACAKHLVAGSASVNGLNSAPTDVSERTLMEVFLPPYKRAIREAAVYSIMAAHNEINGIPCHMDKHLMTDMLRGRWGFDGFYVSDWNDVSRIASVHYVAEDFKEATLLSVDAGMDMHMHGPGFADHVEALVLEGALPESRIDYACGKILEAKFRLGLFENPMVEADAAEKVVFSTEHQTTALETARKSMTLLKNNGILPLNSTEFRKILVSGPNANNMTTLGDWVVPQPDDRLITVWEGLQAEGKNEGIEMTFFDVGERSKEISDSDLDRITTLAAASDLTILVLGENSFRHAWRFKTTGENVDRATLQLSGKQLQLARNAKAAGKPLIVVLINGSPISEPWLEENADAILEGWEPGSFGGQAVAETLFGRINPGGKLPVTIPRSVGQLQMVYNHKPSAYIHRYHTEKKIPLYDFGFGLSYTTFSYSTPVLSGKIEHASNTVSLSVSVTNTGDRSGDEVVQLYVRDDRSSVTRPIKELKGYQRLSLAPGETDTATFTLKPDAFAFYDRDMQYGVEAGTFTLMIGSSSRDSDLQQVSLTITNDIPLKE